MIEQEPQFTAPYTCPICLRVTQHNNRHTLDIGLRAYVMCKGCFDTLDALRSNPKEQYIRCDEVLFVPPAITCEYKCKEHVFKE